MDYKEYRHTCTNCRHANSKVGEKPCKECLELEDAKKAPPFNKWGPKER